jgi:hypothetical protein
LAWIRDNRRFLAELILVVIFAISLALIGMVTVRRQTAVFQGIKTTVIHVPGPDGATLVTFIRDGRAYGREFPDQKTAVAFAEALR